MYELVALLTSANAWDAEACASSAGWCGLVTLEVTPCVSDILRDPVARLNGEIVMRKKRTFFFCFRQASQPRPVGTPGIVFLELAQVSLQGPRGQY